MTGLVRFWRSRLAVCIGILWSLVLAPASMADIRDTPHSLGKKKEDVDPKEICVFCHTPTVNAKESSVVQPLWQKASVGADHVFTIYDDIGRLQFGEKQAVGSQSMACLSCHDSAQAMSISNFSADHPFGVPYRGFTKSNKIDTPTSKGDAPAVEAKQLKSVGDFREPRSATMQDRTVWWVPSGQSSGTRTRGDLPLYVRRDTNGGEIPYIECGSCHDPHSSNPTFLRVLPEGSKLCLTCHDK